MQQMQETQTPGQGRDPGVENGTPLKHSCLENTMGTEAWQATVHVAAKSWTRVSKHTFKTYFYLLAITYIICNETFQVHFVTQILEKLSLI